MKTLSTTLKRLLIIAIVFGFGLSSVNAQFTNTKIKKSSVKKSNVNIIKKENLLDYEHNECTKTYARVTGKANFGANKVIPIELGKIVGSTEITVQKTKGKAAAKAGYSYSASKSPSKWEDFRNTNSLLSRTLRPGNVERVYVTIDNKSNGNKFEYRINSNKTFKNLLADSDKGGKTLNAGQEIVYRTTAGSCSGKTRIFTQVGSENDSEFANILLRVYERVGNSWRQIKSVRMNQVNKENNSGVAWLVVNSDKKLKVTFKNTGSKNLSYFSNKMISVRKK